MKYVIIASDNGASTVPSHYVKQCWLIIMWNLTNKFQWMKVQSFSFIQMILKCRQRNSDHFAQEGGGGGGGGGGGVSYSFYCIIAVKFILLTHPWKWKTLTISNYQKLYRVLYMPQIRNIMLNQTPKESMCGSFGLVFPKKVSFDSLNRVVLLFDSKLFQLSS